MSGSGFHATSWIVGTPQLSHREPPRRTPGKHKRDDYDLLVTVALAPATWIQLAATIIAASAAVASWAAVAQSRANSCANLGSPHFILRSVGSLEPVQ